MINYSANLLCMARWKNSYNVDSILFLFSWHVGCCNNTVALLYRCCGLTRTQFNYKREAITMPNDEFILPVQKTFTAVISREERYDLIAQAAMSINEKKEYRDNRAYQIWDIHDIDLNVNDAVDLYA